MEVGREEVSFVVVYGVARIATEKIADMTEMSVAAWMKQLVVAQRGHVENKNIVVVLAVFGHCVRNDAWDSGSMPKYDAVAIVDIAYSFLWGRDFSLIFVFPVHNCLEVYMFMF